MSASTALVPKPAKSLENIRERIDRLLRPSQGGALSPEQLALSFEEHGWNPRQQVQPTQAVSHFLDFLCDVGVSSEVYLFGGILRDVALYGKGGFSSDVDVVVEGDWEGIANYLRSTGARLNKFGGFRLTVAKMPVDIWNAKETWAVRRGLVEYSGISSLTSTTVLNWDAILMNWRTGAFVCSDRYLHDLGDRVLDVVLQENPNPKGMLVRVLRHLCLKDARKITARATRYLLQCVDKYTIGDLRGAELKSYGNSVIEPAMFLFFERMSAYESPSIRARAEAASASLLRDNVELPLKQTVLDLGER